MLPRQLSHLAQEGVLLPSLPLGVLRSISTSTEFKEKKTIVDTYMNTQDTQDNGDVLHNFKSILSSDLAFCEGVMRLALRQGVSIESLLEEAEEKEEMGKLINAISQETYVIELVLKRYVSSTTIPEDDEDDG